MKNIGIIGFGKMGMLHAGIINALHDSRIVSIAESSDFIQKASKGLMNNISFHRDYQNMIKKENLDGIVITTPVWLHAEMMNYCFQNNLSMLVEKPLCRKLSELDFTLDDLIKRKISLVTGYCLLFKDTFVKVKELLSKNIIGEVLWVKGFINVQQIFKQSNNWQYNKETAGGGVMIGLSSHLISVLAYLFGKEKEVHSVTRRYFSKDVEDIGLALIRFEDDIICSIESSWSKFNCRLPRATIEINGEYGQILADETEVSIFLNEDRLGLTSGWTKFTQADLFKGVEFDIGGAEFTNQDRLFIDSIDSDSDVWCNYFIHSVTTQRIIEKVYGN